MDKEQRKRWKRSSLQTKQILAFTTIIVSFMAIMFFLHIRTLKTVREMTYDKMRAQAEYYLESFEMEVSHAINLQIEIFNDRKLAFLAQPEAGLDDFEKRDALLSVKEKLSSIAGVSNLVESCTIYMPKSEYKITDSAVRRMNADDFEEMWSFVDYENGSISYDGEKFYSVEMGQTRGDEDEAFNFMFVLTFSGGQIENKLSLLNTTANSGAFIYSDKYHAMVQSSTAHCSSARILSELKKDEQGEYVKVQEVKAGGENYLVFVGGNGSMGTFVQYTEEGAVMGYIKQSWIYLSIGLLILLGISIFFVIYTNRTIHKPIGLLLEAFGRVKEGNLNQHIYRLIWRREHS